MQALRARELFDAGDVRLPVFGHVSRLAIRAIGLEAGGWSAEAIF
jgi:hypothetical protein